MSAGLITSYFGWFIDLIDWSLKARRPVYIQTCLPYSQPYSSPYQSPFAYPFALRWAALYWYEPLSWGISSYTNCISNRPQLWGSWCRYTCNTICPAPTAYQASYQAHHPAPRLKGTRNAFLALMGSRVDCFLCRWRRSQRGSGEGMKPSIKCEDCNEALCFTPKQNCFHEFHHM